MNTDLTFWKRTLLFVFWLRLFHSFFLPFFLFSFFFFKLDQSWWDYSILYREGNINSTKDCFLKCFPERNTLIWSGYHCSLTKCMVIISYLGLLFPLAGKGLKLEEIIQLHSLLLVFKLPRLLCSFCIPAWGIEPSSEDGKFELFWPRLELILSFHSTQGIRLLFNVNDLPIWLSFCMTMALGLLDFSYMDDKRMPDVFEKSWPVSAVCAWTVNAETAWGLWKGLKA